MGAKSIIAGLLTVLLVLTGVYYFTDKGKNFSLFPKRTKTTISKQTGTTQTGNAVQNNPENLKGKGQIMVTMSANTFNPAIFTIDAGTVVTWKNNDTVSHIINTDPNSTPNMFATQNSGEIRPGEMYSIKFDVPGDYPYRCSIHIDNGMAGRVTVE